MDNNTIITFTSRKRQGMTLSVITQALELSRVMGLPVESYCKCFTKPYSTLTREEFLKEAKKYEKSHHSKRIQTTTS